MANKFIFNKIYQIQDINYNKKNSKIVNILNKIYQIQYITYNKKK